MSDWRKNFITGHFTKEGLGLEIGPSHSPLASKQEGYNVKIVDHASQKDLIKKYKNMDIDTSQIEPVDYVWDGTQTLTDLIAMPRSFEYIIASHLVEHTTDLITFLRDCQQLLKPNGKLCLAIPDKRYHFDYFRFPSTVGDLLQAYYNKHVRHTPGKVFDFLINSVSRGDKSAWSSEDSGELALKYDLKFAKQMTKKAINSKEYIDIHNWMFTPASFKLLIHDLQSLGILKLSYVDQLPTQGFEFFVILSPKAPPITDQRIDLVKAVMDDIKAMYGIEEAALKAEVAALKDEINSIKQSRRWRYTQKPAQIISAVRRKR